MTYLPPRKPAPTPLVRSYTILGPNQRWPQALPYPAPLALPPGTLVPNSTAINWPQSQFAPQHLPPGSGSAMTYNSNPQPRVLYGMGNPNDVTTPRGSFAGSQYGDAADPQPTTEQRLHAWAAVGLGVIFGVLLCYTNDVYQNKPRLEKDPLTGKWMMIDREEDFDD